MMYDLRFNSKFKIQNSKFQRKSGGFSLVEVLVGASVLIISVTGTLSIIARNVSSAAIAAERVTAFYLAQEALEYVRGVRDNNAITGNSWLNDPVSDCAGTIANPACNPLLLRESDGVYNYDSGTPTVFTREVVIKDIAAGEEVRVNATVKWPQGLVTRSFTISGHLFNWR
ncbi:MAG: hypothetical protein HYT29_02455 [Parcubacteria group bacterium]|nr:hypothetical protein [Parcubacteria group bacterium]